MSDFSVAVLSLAACVFIASAVAKLRDRQAYRSFRSGLDETGLVPAKLLALATALLSIAEGVIAVALVAAIVLTAVPAAGAVPVGETALAAAAALTAMLAAGIAVVIRRGTQAGCACFGAGSDRPLGWPHLIRDLGLLAALGAGLAAVPLERGRPAMAGAVLAAAAGALSALVLIRFDQLAELFAPLPPPPGTARPVGRPGRGNG
jgi:hypothetical protein